MNVRLAVRRIARIAALAAPTLALPLATALPAHAAFPPPGTRFLIETTISGTTYCLQINPIPADSSLVFAACSTGGTDPAQAWTHDTLTGHVRSVQSGKCIDVDGEQGFCPVLPASYWTQDDEGHVNNLVLVGTYFWQVTPDISFPGRLVTTKSASNASIFHFTELS
ncbi:hypothetical protein [Kitasatospora sp. NPDC087271]|uniref:hypothetical protein n=1 Tax=Kitasatospora sp. NPDC087271 TaxID=3364067 RepID=UPI0037FA3D4E